MGKQPQFQKDMSRMALLVLLIFGRKVGGCMTGFVVTGLAMGRSLLSESGMTEQSLPTGKQARCYRIYWPPKEDGSGQSIGSGLLIYSAAKRSKALTGGNND